MSVNIFQQQFGTGPNLVFLHGWALNHHVWNGITPHLSSHYHLQMVDLPGHGRSTVDTDHSYDLDQIAKQLLLILPEHCTLVGWSLGSLIATEIALRYPQRVDKLIWISGTPRFMQDTDWPKAMALGLFDQFASELVVNYHATILRFLAIQSMGSEKAREEIRQLRESVFIDGEPHLHALQGGLDILQGADLRKDLHKLRCPLHILYGQNDTLVPAQQPAAFERLNIKPTLAVIKGAGHAPFISHPTEFIEQFVRCVNE